MVRRPVWALLVAAVTTMAISIGAVGAHQRVAAARVITPAARLHVCPRGYMCDSELGVALVVPGGWTQAPPGKRSPGSLAFWRSGPQGVMGSPRLVITGIGVADPRYAAAAAQAAADALTQGLSANVSVGHVPTIIAGSPAVLLLGLPGAASGRHIVATHEGALYRITTFDGDDVAMDQRRALASIRFLPRRATPFPPAGPPQALIAALRDLCVEMRGVQAGGRGALGGAPRLAAAFTMATLRGNDTISSVVMGTKLRPHSAVALTVCWSRGDLPTYSWYQKAGPLRADGAGNVTLRLGFSVPAGSFREWTVRVVVANARTGGVLAAYIRPGRSREQGPETGAYAYVPHTSHVAPGRAYPFTLFTHCGLRASLVDFDSSLWDVADAAWIGSNGNPPPGIGNPFQKGAMTLLGSHRARFSFGRSQISFVRHQGVKYLPLCS